MFDLFKKESVPSIHVNDMDPLLGSVDLIDIRESYEFNTGSLKTAKNIPMGILLNEPDKYLKKDKNYYILCQSGARSGNASRMLVKQGYRVVNVSGGMGSYAGTKRTS